MRIVAPLVCTLLLSLALPWLSFAGSAHAGADSREDVRNYLAKNDNDDDDYKGKGRGNCNDNGNCDKAKDKAKDKSDYDDDDYLVNCQEIRSLTLRRECIEKRRD